MSEMPDQVNINGSVTGQIAIGNYINQFQNLNGCNINITTTDLRPIWEARRKPVSVKPRPPQLFLDRSAEVEIVQKSAQVSQPVTLSGEAGIGKSTLLKQISHLMRIELFPDGIFYFSSSGLKLEDLLQALFSAFFTSNFNVKPDRAQLQQALSEIRAVIVIDDFDPNPDAFQLILDVAPNSMFVVASDKKILYSGSRNIQLVGFPENDAVTLFENVFGRLLNANERQIVCEINEMLNGHPERLYWLAATIREDGLDLDRVREKIKVDSLQVFLFDSIQALPDRQQSILAILSTIESQPLSQDHLTALLQGEPVRQAVNALTARGYLQVQNQTIRIGKGFSQALAQSWGLRQWEEALTRYFVSWLGQNPSRNAIWEVRGALRLLMEKAAHRKDWSAVIRLGRALEPFFIASGYWQAWYEILQHILEAAKNIADQKLEGWALHQLGSRSLCLGATEQAKSLLQQAASIRHSIGDRAGLQLTQHNLSLVPAVIPVTGVTATTPQVLISTKAMVIAAVGTIATVAVGASLAAVALLYTPRPPALTQPENAFIQTSGQSPQFGWNSVIGSSAYEIQLDDQADFNSTIIDQTLPVTSFAPGIPLGQTIYYWRVRANSPSGKQGNWSETRQFTVSIPPGVPSLTQPPNQFIVTSPASLSFTWTNIENAANYQIQIDNTPDFSSPEIDSPVPGTAYSSATTSTLPQGIYSWHVRAANPFGTPGDWSSSWTFTISIPPTRVLLVEPANASKLETTTTPVFQWRSVENASQYEIQVDDNSDFSSPQYDAKQTGNRFPIQASFAQGSYSWRVRALNADEQSGDWSDTWSFLISIPPGVPTLISPADGSVQVSTDMSSLTWGVVQNAANYVIQIDDSPNFDSVNFGTRTNSTRIQPSGALAPGLYYWRVQALNPYDTAGSWSTPWRVTVTVPPAAPILVSPPSGSQFDTFKPISFTWQSVANAVQYQIVVDNNTDFSSPVFETTLSSTSVSTNQPLPPGEYVWHVRAANSNGITGGWSDAWYFDIPLAAPMLIAPTNQSLVYYDDIPTPDFRWSSVQNASQYQIQVDAQISFSNPSVDQRTTATSLTIPGSLYTQQPDCENGNDQIYFWRVAALDPSGKPGLWSTVWKVTIHFTPIC